MNSNVCILGFGNSGKSTFVNKILGSKRCIISATIGVEYNSKKVYYKGKQFRWQIWDCGNFSSYHKFLNTYIKRSHIFLVFLDLSSPIYGQNIDHCINTIYDYNENPHIILVCSKADKKKIVSNFDILNITNTYEIDFIKISTKDDSFDLLIDVVNKYMYDNDLTYDNLIKKSLTNKKVSSNKKIKNRSFCCIF